MAGYPGGEDTARREKERAIRRRFSAQIERALKNLAAQVKKGQLKDRQKIERRLGGIQARHPQVADLYEMGVTERKGRLAVDWKHLRRRNRSDLSPAQSLALLSTLQSADPVLPTTDGREIRLRRVATPSPEQQRLLTQLGMTLPQRFNLSFECSVDPAIA